MYILIDNKSKPLTAHLLARYERPDRDLSRLRGNVQTLPSGNVFVGWSQQGYHSEFTPDGDLVMEARFVSDRFSTYRSYKFPFTGRPVEPPVLVAFLNSDNAGELSTAMYISWNGATEVQSYRFWAKSAADKPSIAIGSKNKTGFETMFMAHGYLDWVSADALDVNGTVLGRTTLNRTIIPKELFANGASENDTQLVPTDPIHTLEYGWSTNGNQTGSHTVAYSYDKEWYSVDWTVLSLALVGGTTLIILFLAVIILLGAYIVRVFWGHRWRNYHELGGNGNGNGNDEEDDDDDESDVTEMQDISYRARYRS